MNEESLIIPLSEINSQDWSNLYKSSKFASPFQSHEYYLFLKNTAGFDVKGFALFSKNSIKAIIVITILKEKGLKGYFSRRGIIFGGPLLGDISDFELETLLIHTSKTLKKNLIYLEIRPSFDYDYYKTSFEKAGWKYNQWLNIVIDITNEELAYNRINSEKRRQIRKSLNMGAEFSIITKPSEEAIQNLYKILHNVYRKKVKKPLPSIDFFIALSAASFCKVLIIYLNSVVIGGAFLIYDNNRIYDWYRIGDDSSYKKFQPGTLAVWGGIKAGIENNCKEFDFMGAGNPAISYGVRDFKSQFGGSAMNYGRYKIVLNPMLHFIGSLGLKILSKIR